MRVKRAETGLISFNAAKPASIWMFLSASIANNPRVLVRPGLGALRTSINCRGKNPASHSAGGANQASR